MASAQNAEKKSKNVGCTCINPTPCARILHPILHPKSSVNTRNLTPWCRKCRRFSKTFFVEGEREKAVLRSGSSKTSDFFGQKYGCFASKVRMFSSKKSDVFIFRKRPLYDTNAVFQKFFLAQTSCPNAHFQQGPYMNSPTVGLVLVFGAVDEARVTLLMVVWFSAITKVAGRLNTERGIHP